MGILEQIGLFEGEKKELKIFLDLDGTITDFNRAFSELGKDKTHGLDTKKFEEKYGSEAFWHLIHSADVEFWSEMAWLPDGKKLWNYVKKHNPTILTTPAKSKASKEGKEIWIKRELGPKVPFIFEKDKHKHANTESILIDDYPKKINDWINLGDGIGILHKSADQTIEELKKYGL